MSKRKWKVKDLGFSKCDVRLTREQDNKLNELAERNGVTRSEILRKSLDDFYKFNSPTGKSVDEKNKEYWTYKLPYEE